MQEWILTQQVRGNRLRVRVRVRVQYVCISWKSSPVEFRFQVSSCKLKFITLTAGAPLFNCPMDLQLWKMDSLEDIRKDVAMWWKCKVHNFNMLGNHYTITFKFQVASCNLQVSSFELQDAAHAPCIGSCFLWQLGLVVLLAETLTLQSNEFIQCFVKQ